MAIVKLRTPMGPPAAKGSPQGAIESLATLQAEMANRSIGSAPCRVDDVAQMLGIKVVHEQMDDEVSGFLEKRGDIWVAGVNSYHHPVRQRFTIAHEIAHYVLHRRKQSEFRDYTFARRNDDRSDMEREADQFAAQLLMPEGEVRAAVDKGLRNLNDLARHFDVSTLAMRYRLDNLGYRMG